MKIISLKVEEDFHKRLKVRTANQGMSIKSYIMDLIEKDMKNEKE